MKLGRFQRTFNRTIEELKQVLTRVNLKSINTFNRTIEELKHMEESLSRQILADF